jgi:hypothetical protein
MEGVLPATTLSQLLAFVGIPLLIGGALAGLAVATGFAGRLVLWCADRVAVGRLRRTDRPAIERAP